MFGYIVPLKETLLKEDTELFRAFYCALCREIGKRSNPARMFLSYDLTFLAVLTSALSKEDTLFGKEKRCVVHPLRPTKEIISPEISYAADMSIILVKEKLKDDVKDENKLSSKMADFIITDRIDTNGDVREIIKEQLEKLSQIEKDNILSPDMAADAFACLTGEMFAHAPIPENEKKAMYWFGYNLGRWVYLLDAFSDLENDIKNGSYNPFNTGEGYEKIRENKFSDIAETLTFTLSEASAAFDLLNIKRYRSILENVLYEGLPARQSFCLFGERKEKRE